MGLVQRLIDRLREPEVVDVDVDGSTRFAVHRRILARKPLLRRVFRQFHLEFERADRDHFAGAGMRIEIGAGVAPVKESMPDVLTSDVVAAPDLDLCLDAQRMSLPDHSVRAIFAQNAFHHFPQPGRFFRELERVLLPGGGAVLIEPYHGPLASFLYPRLFATEGFDKDYPGWEVPATGPMNGANQALSYVVFVRDRKRFETEFPQLEIVSQEPLPNAVGYLLSGGLNFRQLVPDFMTPLVELLERALSPLRRLYALHQVIVLRRRGP
jgi:SAM-dependent methyltransferase